MFVAGDISSEQAGRAYGDCAAAHRRGRGAGRADHRAGVPRPRRAGARALRRHHVVRLRRHAGQDDSRPGPATGRGAGAAPGAAEAEGPRRGGRRCRSPQRRPAGAHGTQGRRLRGRTARTSRIRRRATSRGRPGRPSSRSHLRPRSSTATPSTEGHYAPECIQVAPGYRPCNAEGGAGYYSLESALEQLGEHRLRAARRPGRDEPRRQAGPRRRGWQIGHLDRGKTCGAHKARDLSVVRVGDPGQPAVRGQRFRHVRRPRHPPPGAQRAVGAHAGAGPAVQGCIASRRATGSCRRPSPTRSRRPCRESSTYGTGRAARQPFPIYGKTGTTDDFTNAWFTGCTHTLCITVWMGYDRPYQRVHGKYVAHELRDVYGSPVFGGTVPAEIFSRIFSDYRGLDAPAAAIGASPYPTYVPTTTSPTATATASASPGPQHTPTAPPSTVPTVVVTTSPTQQRLLRPPGG